MPLEKKKKTKTPNLEHIYVYIINMESMSYI